MIRIPFLTRPAARPGSPETAATPPAKKGLTGFFPLPFGGSEPGGRAFPVLAREGYMKNPVAFRSIRLIAESAATVPWLIAQAGRPLDTHPVLDLLARPNPGMTGIDFLEAAFGHLMIGGNAFIAPVVLGGALREMHLLRPDRVRLVAGPDGWPEAYEYRSGAMVTRYPARGDGPSLLHLKTFHPVDDHAGFAALSAASAALDLSNAATAWNKALIENSARPSGALVYQAGEAGNLTAEQYERLKAELAEGYSGPARAGRPMLLEGGLDWKSMGLSPREMDFAEARNGAARDIALALGVPPMLIGIPGDNTFANYQEANRAFWRLTVLPLLARTAASFSAWFGHAFNAPLTLSHDLDQIAGLVAERDQLWARLGAATFLTEDEKREAVGYGPRAAS